MSKLKIRWFVRQVLAAVLAQFQLSRHNIEDLMPILTVPLLTLVSMAILMQSGRQDLAGYALVASLLMNIGQMGFFVGSEIISLDRRSETLELIVAALSR